VAEHVNSRDVFLDNLLDVLFILRRDGTLSYVNRAARTALGCERGEVLGRHFTSFVHPDDLRRAGQDFLKMIEGAPQVKLEVRVAHKDGRWLCFEAVATNLLSHAAVDGVLVNMRDITERKRLEADLVNAAEAWRRTVDGIRDALCLLDRDRRILRCNKAMAALCGRPFEDLMGHTPCEFIHGDKEPVKDCPVPRLGSAGGRETAEFETKGRRLQVVVDPVFDAAGNVEGAVHVITDVTERRALEAQLAQSQKMEAVGQLAGGVAHDFNNILSVILSTATILKDEEPPGSTIVPDLKEIIKAGERGATLARQLLTFSRRRPVSLAPVDLSSLVNNLWRLLQRLIGEDIALHLRLDPAIGEIEADPGGIEQVVMNLAVNARDAMPRGGELFVETKRAVFDEEYVRQHAGAAVGEYALLLVSDTGTGMTPEVKERIFEPFFTTKEAGKGTGLGLSTVFGIVKQHNGHVFVYSQPGRGTTFKVAFPLLMSQGQTTAKPAEQVDPDALRGNETVLVVEDDPCVRRSVCRILGKFGYRLVEAEDGAEGIEKLRSAAAPIDLLLTDVVLPKLSGSELAAKLGEISPKTKVLFMSGYTDDFVALRGVLPPGAAFIQKPMSAEALGRKVKEVLGGNA
jgi:PAS domain S-box-containing protein